MCFGSFLLCGCTFHCLWEPQPHSQFVVLLVSVLIETDRLEKIFGKVVVKQVGIVEDMQIDNILVMCEVMLNSNQMLIGFLAFLKNRLSGL